MPSMRLTLAADTTVPVADAPPAAVDGANTFHAVLAVEETWTGDMRFFETNAFTWRELPLPMMADDENNFGHEKSKLIGNITAITRVGKEIRADGEYVTVADPTSEDGQRVLHLQGLMRAGSLKGVSVDLDDPDLTVEIPIEGDPFLEAETDGDPESEPAPEADNVIRIEVNKDTMPREIYHSVRIMGATALPFPALQEAHVEPDAVAASARITGWVDDGLALLAAAGIKPPLLPPSDWLKNPRLSVVSPLSVDDNGRITGHIADLSSCHIGFGDRCVQPPLSQTDYAWFNLGEVLCEDGSRVAAGVLTMDTGHAPMDASMQDAIAHYDHTGTAVADVVAGEDEFGIWVAGAVRPGVNPEKVRALMASKPSGDWRRVRGNLEMCAVLMVNVPGFPIPRLRAKVTDGVTASLVASLPFIPRRPQVAAQAPLVASAANRAAANRIAKSIGRDRAARVKALTERVHG